MDPLPTLRDLVTRTAGRLAAAPNPPHPREAETLVLAAAETSVTAYLADPARPAPPQALERLEAFLRRRLDGEPIQHLLGEWDFHGRPFRVDRRALVPRPETEQLIEAARAHHPRPTSALDLGTGTGVLAVTAALEFPSLARVVAIDRSPAAAALARENARRLGARVRVIVSDWDAPLAGHRFDLVLSNPPYLDRADRDRLAPEVREFDPADALFADGDDPLAAIRQVLGAAARRLLPGGIVVVEFGDGQETAMAGLAEEQPALALEEIRPDLAGRPRMAVLRAR